jgi:hypothetical protein
VEPNTPTTGHLRYVRRDERSHLARKKPLLLEYTNTSKPAEHITLRKALRLQEMTLQVSPLPAMISMAALVKPTLPEQFDLSSPAAVQAAHLLFDIELPVHAATSWFQRYTQPVAPLQQQDCLDLLSNISLHPASTVFSVHSDTTLSAAVAARYRTQISTAVWPSGLLPPQFVPTFFAAANKKKPAEWIFTAAAPGTEALALALAAEHATMGVFILAPYAALSAAPLEFRQLLQAYKCSDRLALIQHSPSRTHTWIAVFALYGCALSSYFCRWPLQPHQLAGHPVTVQPFLRIALLRCFWVPNAADHSAFLFPPASLFF